MTWLLVFALKVFPSVKFSFDTEASEKAKKLKEMTKKAASMGTDITQLFMLSKFSLQEEKRTQRRQRKIDVFSIKSNAEEEEKCDNNVV